MKTRAIDLTPFRLAVEERICRICDQHRPDGGCRRAADDPCPLVTHLDPLVRAVLRVRPKHQIEDYIAQIRKDVCPTCREEEGTCEQRNLAACPADAYIVPLVETLEDVARAQRLLWR